MRPAAAWENNSFAAFCSAARTQSQVYKLLDMLEVWLQLAGARAQHTLTAPGLLNAGAGWPGPEHGVALPLAACWLLHAAQHSGTGFTVAEILVSFSVHLRRAECA